MPGLNTASLLAAGPSLEKVVLAENGQPEGRFAFDNPYMIEDDDIGSKSKYNAIDEEIVR